MPSTSELNSQPAGTPAEAAPPAKRVPWASFVLLLVAAFVLWNARPVVPSEAPMGEVPPALGEVRAWLVPTGASAAPTHSGSIDFAALKGRVVFLEFYATWCPPCRGSLKALNERPPHPDLSVVGLTAVDSQQSAAEIRVFASQQSFATALVTSEAIRSYGVKQIPYAVLVGRDGKVAWKGNPLDSDCEEALAAALAAPGSD